MWQVILGRALSGSGQAGMWVLAAVVITGEFGSKPSALVQTLMCVDLVPLREVAPWQSYLNVIATIGRSFGGPFGGWLADMVGWRW